MSLKPFDPDVLKHKVVRIVVGDRVQIDPVASIVLNARLISVSGQVTAQVYTDRDADYTDSAPITSAESEESLIAFAVLDGTSDAQSPLAPPTHFDYGMFLKAEGDVDAVALLELTYVHRVDYARSFEPIQVSTWENPEPPLGEILGLPDVPPWIQGTDDLPQPPDNRGPYTIGGGDNLTAPDGILLSLWEQTVGEGDTVTVGVSLMSQPLNDVELLVTNDSVESSVDMAALKFTSSNWASPQNVVITAVDDADSEVEESVIVRFAVTSGDNVLYSPLLTPDSVFTLVVIDNELTEYGMFLSTRDILLIEGTASTVSLALRSQPTADVTVTVAVGALAGRAKIDVGGGYLDEDTLTFTSVNWNTAQVISVLGTVDAIENSPNPLQGSISCRVTASVDPNYSALTWSRAYLSVLLYDDEAPNFAVGTLLVSTEDRDGDFTYPNIILETSDAFLRLE
jgi:hypothetical protein